MILLDMIPNAKEPKAKNRQRDCIKLKSFCITKEAIKSKRTKHRMGKILSNSPSTTD